MTSVLHQFTSLWKRRPEDRFEPVQDLRTQQSKTQRQQEELLARARRARLQNVALGQRLEKRAAQLDIQITGLIELAKEAVMAGRDDVARLALQQGHLASSELRALQIYTREVRLERKQVAMIEQRLAAQIQAAQIKGEMATDSRQGASSASRSQWTDLGESIELAENKIESMQARAYALEHRAEFAALDLSMGTVGEASAHQAGSIDIRAEVERQLDGLKGSNGLIAQST